MYSIISANSECYFFSDLDSFYFFSSLIDVARTFKTMLNNSHESRHPCLIPDLRGIAFSFSPPSMMLAMGIPYMAFILLR